jgi:tetratricopeptide (TPR) repeat protein
MVAAQSIPTESVWEANRPEPSPVSAVAISSPSASSNVRGGYLRFRDPEAAYLYFRNQPGTARKRLALAEHGFALRYSDPAAMRAWCDAALVGLPPETDAHTAALLHGYAGNAHRIVGDFASAEHLLNKAFSLCSADPLLLQFKASLLYDLRRLTEASETLSHAAALRRQQKDPLALAATLLQSAMVLELTAHTEEAASIALSAVRAIASHPPSKKGEELLRTALQNLSSYLTGSGRPMEALQVLRHSRSLLTHGGYRFELRMDWLLARICSALGDDAGARETYVVVRERFAAERMLQEVALISLDLARHLLPTSPLEARAEVACVDLILIQLGIPEDSPEVRLLHSILASTQPDLALLTELSRALSARPIMTF